MVIRRDDRLRFAAPGTPLDALEPHAGSESLRDHSRWRRAGTSTTAAPAWRRPALPCVSLDDVTHGQEIRTAYPGAHYRR
jgi:hypothetical protein